VSDHVLHLGDCLPGLAGLPDRSVDLVVTDPPYAVSNVGMWHYGRPGKGKRRFDFFEGDADFEGMVKSVLAVARETIRVMAPHASAYWWCGHREFGPLVSLFEEHSFKTRFLVWAKKAPSPPPPGSGWPSGAELCVFAFPQTGRIWNHDGRNPPPNNVLIADSFRHGQPGKEDHPTQKPLTVVAPLIAASSREGHMVLDPYAGSGTTLVAAKQLGRRAVGWERDPKYHAAAVRRIESVDALFAAAKYQQARLLP
jgi:site-specific DNA-methyltransferase (adenine-specific)